ncbi:MAG: TlpA disulfide reductase family protein [Chlorobium sp.]|jgi:cytochrome c biogenesis protein CcmG, thiol:disulfide interchange protein DsbE|nr:MAG: TlpA family protein disulfide reductase [Chlorobium sp.]
MINCKSKKFRVILLALSLCVGFSESTFALEAGNKAPDFDLPGDQGMVKLSKSEGSVVYVDFWASWCGPCRQSFSWMNDTQEKYRSQGLKIIGINLDAKNEDAKKFLTQIPAKFTIAYDSKGVIPKNYGVKGMPTSFLIGRDGKIIFQHLGFKDADRESLDKQIKAALEARK